MPSIHSLHSTLHVRTSDAKYSAHSHNDLPRRIRHVVQYRMPGYISHLQVVSRARPCTPINSRILFGTASAPHKLHANMLRLHLTRNSRTQSSTTNHSLASLVPLTPHHCKRLPQPTINTPPHSFATSANELPPQVYCLFLVGSPHSRTAGEAPQTTPLGVSSLSTGRRSLDRCPPRSPP
jgi:hypothetical protein